MKFYYLFLGTLFIFIGCEPSSSMEWQSIDFQVESFDWDKKPYATSRYIQDSILPQQGNQYSAWAYSYIGDITQTLITWDGERALRSTAVFDSAYLARLKVYKDTLKAYSHQLAVPVILDLAQGNQITIINEAHQSPQHRIFITSLLQGMYDNGYHHLGMEGYFTTHNVAGDVSSDLELGYPTMKTGYYVKEPQFGNLIREARRIGFQLFGYESEGHNGSREREINQATNIKTYMDQHSGEKILLHCGFAHAMEGYMGGGFEYAMAARLSEYTGINPLTIDQTRYAEKSNRTYENPYAQVMDVDEPTVLINADGEIFNKISGSATVDICVFHPRSKSFDRPEWMMTGNRKMYDIDFNNLDMEGTCLVYAYIEDEPIGVAVPYDIQESNDKKSRMVLKKGKYNIVIQGEEESYIAPFVAD